jgi:5-oxoprolinase (ATP-hydrolysing) subunit A
MRVLLNVDLAELPEEPDELYAIAHLANIACGGHAGDDASMRRALELCRAHGTRAGAHPSYPDRPGFGRRPLEMTDSAVRASVAEQCARLASIARLLGQSVVFLKPHGALYHATLDRPALAEAVVGAAAETLGGEVTVVGPARGELPAAAARARLRYAREGFADRTTRADGTLVPRDQPHALILDPTACADRARTLASGGEVETVCVHGDSPGAVSIARAVRDALDALAEK